MANRMILTFINAAIMNALVRADLVTRTNVAPRDFNDLMFQAYIARRASTRLTKFVLFVIDS